MTRRAVARQRPGDPDGDRRDDVADRCATWRVRCCGGTRHLHVSSYFLLEHSLGPGLAELFAEARAGGATTSLDTNWDPAGRWGGDQLRAALAQYDFLLPNEAEARHLSGEPTLRAAIPVLTAMGPRVVVKLGASGALCADGNEFHRIEPPARFAGPWSKYHCGRYHCGRYHCRRYHGRRGLLQRRADRWAAARHGSAVGGPAWLRGGLSLHSGRRRYGGRADPVSCARAR